MSVDVVIHLLDERGYEQSVLPAYKVSNRSRTSAPLLEHGLAKLCALVQTAVGTPDCRRE